MDGPKLLVLDIETAPNVVYTWGLHKQYIAVNQIIQRGGVICFAAKWRGKDKVEFRSDFHDGHDKMLERAHALIDEADAIIHYNGRAFDMKHLQREFLLAGLGPPSPHKDVDLLAVVRSRFRFGSNKLENVLIELGLDGKEETGGFPLWPACLAGDKKAWAKMRAYNIGDVRKTDAVYERVLPWIKGHPHWGLYGPRFQDEDRCQNCGSPELMRRGYYMTDVGRYTKWRCEKCGKYSRGRRRVGNVDARGVA